MTPAAALADRNAAVQKAAWAWRRAGAIDDGTLAAIYAAYPDERRGAGPVFQILFFLFTLVSIGGAFGFLLVLFDAEVDALFPVFLFLFGAGLLVAADFLAADRKRTRGGVEEAMSLAGIGFLAGLVYWFCDKAGLKDHAFPVTLLIAALLLAGAVWQWGYSLYGGAAAAAFLAGFLSFPGTRLLWILLPLLAAPVLARLAESGRLPPAHRTACALALGVALAALYVAVHIGSLDSHLLEESQSSWLPSSGLLRGLSIAATALVPAIYLGIGLRARRYVFLLLGAGTGAASLVTLRFYVHLAPLWVILTLSGAALVVLVFGLRRYLDSGAGKERHGYTAEPLFEETEKRAMLEAAAAVLSLSPEARPVHEESKFAGGGGSFGGGGATGEF